MIECKNCGHEFEGNFCPQCGQKVITKRFNLKDSIAWLLNSIFNLDHGFLYTTKELFRNPGNVIRSVLSGVTVHYTHPFRILFVWATISTLITIFSGILDEQAQEIYKNMEFSEQQAAFQTKVNMYIKKYLNFITMANVPFISLLTYLFYKKKGYNYTEHLVINSYGFTITTVVGIFIILAQTQVHQPVMMMWLSMLSSVIFMAYVFSSTIKENYFLSFFKYLLSFILSFVVIMITFSLVLIIMAILAEYAGIGENPFPSPAKAQ